MFTYLKVKNFALIEDVAIEFKTGFTAFVGETGAGKSLLVDAINILSGARSSVSYVKNGTEYAEIQGAFYLPQSHVIYKILEHADIDADPSEDIVVSRRITKEGRTVCKIQGNIVPAQLLKQMMSKLVDIHGQHESSYLLEDKNHLFLIDVYAKNTAVLSKYKTCYQKYYQLKKDSSRFIELENELINLPEYKKQLEQLEQSNVGVDELEELQSQFTTLKDFGTNFDMLQQVQTILHNDALMSELYSVIKLLENATAPSIKVLSERMHSAYYEMDDVRMVIGDEIDTLAAQKELQATIEARIAEIFTLQRKFGDDLELAKDMLLEKINAIEHLEYDMIQNDAELVKTLAELKIASGHLTESRQIAAQSLAKKIMQELADLYLGQVIFSVQISPQEIGVQGMDKVAFYIQTNVGDVSKPLAEIASGGELSRIMLAIKVVFASQQTLSTIIFDEIDTGVSGKVAQAIAKKMQYFSNCQQVFAITHLPQVLAASTQQLNIWKYVENGATHVSVKYLSATEHVQEVAKMLSGSEIHESGMKHAEELIQSLQ